LKPTGAGDAFMGGFVTGIMAGLDLEAAVKRGTAAAAIVVTRVGCAPAMPDEAELQQFMSLNKLTRYEAYLNAHFTLYTDKKFKPQSTSS